MLIPIGNEIQMDEQWIDIPHDIIPYAFENRYLISTWGRIFNKDTNNILPKNIYYDKDKYITIHLSSPIISNYYIQPHRILLLCYDYNPNYNELDVNHKDGVKCHNWLWNLEWTTRSQNIQHALKNDLFNVGETRNNTKLKEEQVRFICKELSEGKSPGEIQTKIEIPDSNLRSIINNIKGGLSWNHISKEYNFDNVYNKQKFTEEQIHSICKFFEINGKNNSYRKVLQYLNISTVDMSEKELDQYNSSIVGIRTKKTFKDICKLYNY